MGAHGERGGSSVSIVAVIWPFLPVSVGSTAYSPGREGTAGGRHERVGTGPVMAGGFVLVSAGFGVLTTISPTSPYLLLVLSLVLLGAGMSLTAAPATGSIMSAVPPAKAGVGSAVNDTTREVGGALGIAVLGSIANAVYRSSVNLDGLSLPEPVREAASESVGAATVLAEGIPGGRELAVRAGAAFTDAFNLASGVAAALALGAAAAVALAFSHKTERAAAGEQLAVVPETVVVSP